MKSTYNAIAEKRVEVLDSGFTQAIVLEVGSQDGLDISRINRDNSSAEESRIHVKGSYLSTMNLTEAINFLFEPFGGSLLTGRLNAASEHSHATNVASEASDGGLAPQLSGFVGMTDVVNDFESDVYAQCQKQGLGEVGHGQHCVRGEGGLTVFDAYLKTTERNANLK